jgi:hypothetical protein
MSVLQVSDESVSQFPSHRHLSSSGSYPLQLSGLGDPTDSNTAAGLALRVTGNYEPLHHGKVEIAWRKKGLVKFYILSLALCAAEAFALRKIDQK